MRDHDITWLICRCGSHSQGSSDHRVLATEGTHSSSDRLHRYDDRAGRRHDGQVFPDLLQGGSAADTIAGICSRCVNPFRSYSSVRAWTEIRVGGLVQVSSTYFVATLCGAAVTQLAQRLSLRIGRVTTLIYMRCCGILALFLISQLEHPGLAALVYIFRFSTMNCIKPLSRSILMDNVAKDERGRWNSIESLGQFAWTVSAVLGGVLVDNFSYRACFVLTCVLYCIATLPLSLIHI